MQTLNIKIELKSPVLFSAQSGDSTLTQTLSFVPGTSLLGLLANRYIKSKGKTVDFSRLFLRGGLRFHNLYPFKDADCYYPCPLNILRSKIESKDFINVFATDEIKPDYKAVSSFAYIKEDYVALHQPAKEIFFHHERDYQKGISKEGVVFNYEALSSEQMFCGKIMGSSDDLMVIKELLESDPDLRLGKSKTSQYGKCRLMECSLKDYQIIDSDSLEQPLMILLSDTIVKNTYGKSSTDTADLERLLGVEILSSAIDLYKVETVVNAHKAKKPSELAFKAGSCFLLKYLPSNYKLFAQNGLGERCHEGFGHISFEENHPYSMSLLTKSSAQVSEPTTQAPPIIRTIAQNCYELTVETYLSNKASEIANVMDARSLSKSLIGRLESFAAAGSFSESFAELRKLSVEKLNKIHMGDKNLKEYLDGIDKEIDTMLANSRMLSLGKTKKLMNLITETGIIERPTDYWKAIFLKTLFLSIRRKLKPQGGKDEKR
ncbi:MAG: hypothetical protein RBR69_01930 [Candidatus Cloacimonadaceae bacterium]|jgi:CRISPR-associated protein Csx10|nr:hypothetical protein [Candidatus Cloacimonadaceae bacterium]